MGIVFLCPGQGSQYKGMLQDYKDDIIEIKDTFKKITNIDIEEIVFSDDENILKSTVNTQLLILTHTYLVWKNLPQSCKEKGVAIAGHSLGEFSSIVCAESISFEDGLKLVYNRAVFMDECVKKHPGGMVAIIGKDYREFEDIIEELSKEGIIQFANFNSPQQTIITGEKELLNKAISLIKERGVKRVIPLKVSGAFHSPLMKEGADKLIKVIDSIEFSEAKIPVLSCATGNLINSSSEIKENLKKQMTSPVYWVKGIEEIEERFHPKMYIEIGPGKVLTGLVKKIIKDSTLQNVDKREDIKEVKC